MCSLLTLWEVGHVFLCACIMLTCHFHPFCCLPLNTVQSMFYAAILFWLASNSIYAYCGAWKFVNPLQFFVLLTNKSMRKKSKKNFPKKRRTQLNQMRQKVSHFIYLRMTDRRIWICFLYHLGPRLSQMSARTGAKHFQ